ncbi:MAG: DUF1622 domain-containing protein [Solobacterium sp.]|nr:DUF1622 domain-containing protein [Solobacterium sp.]
MLEILEKGLELIVEYGELLLAFTGVLILLYHAVKGIIMLLKHDKLSPLFVGKGISLSLEFLMCGEVLGTVLADCPEDYIRLAVLVALRAAMSVIITWEMKNEKKELEEENEAE